MNIGEIRTGLLISANLLFVLNVSAQSHDDEDLVQLDTFDVVSTGTGTARLAKDLPIRTEVLSADLFLRSASRDLGAALEYLPGVRSEANCQNCGTAEIKILGLGAGYNRLLFDSQPLFSGLASVYGIEQIPTAFIERIEVVKGGASSLYGPGAVAGVINILPKEPLRDGQRLDLSFESVDGEPFYSTSLIKDWTAESGNSALSMYGQFNDSLAVDLNDDGFSEITEKRFYTIGTNTWMYPTETGKLSFNYGHSSEYRRGGDNLDLLPHESQITEQLEHDWHRGGISWEDGNDSGFIYRLAASASYVKRDSYYGGVGDTPLPGQIGYNEAAYNEALEASRLLYGYTDSMRTYLATFFSHTTGEHAISWGGQYQYDRVFDEKRDELNRPLQPDGSLANASGDDPIADGYFSDLGFFIQDEWTPDPSFSLTTGLRIDKHSELSDWVASPRLAIRHTASPSVTWRASVATGFRAPEIFDEDFHIEILDDPTRTRNAEDLEEESSTSYSSGFVWTPPAAENRLQVEGEVFRTELRDTFFVSDIVVEDPSGISFKERKNAGGSTVQGVEWNTSYRLTDRWSAEVGVTYLDASYDDAQEVLPGVFVSRYLENPEWSGVAQVRYENDDFADFFLGLVYTGPMIVAREGEGTLNRSTDEFLVVDLTVTKHLHMQFGGKTHHIDILLGVKNIFDERQQDLTSGPNRDTAYFYGPRFPRSFVLRVGTDW